MGVHLDIGWTKTADGYTKGFNFGNRKGNYTNIIKTTPLENIILTITESKVLFQMKKQF